MKKLLFALLCAALLAGCSDKKLGDEKSDKMKQLFPDPIFRAYVMENFDIDGDGKISKEEAEAVTSIDVRKDSSTSDDEKIASLEGIQYFTNLTYLYCSYNKLTELDVTQNTALTHLDCDDNQLTKLDVTQNTALETLYCYSNQLTKLVTQNPALGTLGCGMNQLTELDVTQNPALESLWCHSNKLTTLNVTQNPALKHLRCDWNQLTELDVTQNTALTSLDCEGNQLTELDVTQNTALEWLWCYSNQLTTLDVSKTNLGNSTEYYPLRCSPMNGSGLETLYLKEGWTIKYIYPERDDDYVPANTQILFKD